MGLEVSEKGGAHDRARIVRRYLSALDGRKPGRSAGRTAELLVHRMHQIDTLLLSADPVQRLHLTQERIDLHAEHLRLQTGPAGEFEALEKAFIRVAKAYGDRHDVTYSAWRQVGVDAAVLSNAGIRQQAKPNRRAEEGATAEVGKPKTAPPEVAKRDGAVPAEAKPEAAKAQAAKAEPTKAEAPKAEPTNAEPTNAAAPKKPSSPKKPPVAKKAAASADNGAAPAKQSKKVAGKKPAAKTEPTPEQQQLPAEAHLLS